VGKIVVNCVLPPLFSKEERAALIDATPAKDASAAEAAIAAARGRALRERVQAESLRRLSAELPVSPSFLPQLFEDAARPSAFRDPGRDPRGHTVTIAYLTFVMAEVAIVAGDDAAEVKWHPFRDLALEAKEARSVPPPPLRAGRRSQPPRPAPIRLAFDHARI